MRTTAPRSAAAPMKDGSPPAAALMLPAAAAFDPAPDAAAPAPVAPAPRAIDAAQPATPAASARSARARTFEPLRILWRIAAGRTPSALITPLASTAAAAHGIARPSSAG